MARIQITLVPANPPPSRRIRRLVGHYSMSPTPETKTGASIARTALGLADRVASLDGRLAVESPAGGGTRVRAELPCA